MHGSGSLFTHRTAAAALVSAAALVAVLVQATPASAARGTPAAATAQAPAAATAQAPTARAVTARATAFPARATTVPALASAQGAPALQVTTLMSGLAFPWDVTFTPDGTMLVTERGGRTLARLPDGTVRTVATTQSDLFVGSEAGLMGIVTDPAFATNRRYYTCQAYKGTGTTPVDIRVVRWTLAPGATSASRTGAPVLTGIPVTTGQHAGCRLRFAPDGTLHIGTGDAITGTNPQDLGSLGGKTLRVRTDGSAPADNPFVARGGRAAYVYTYGHRNVQGLAVRPGTTQLWSAEQGTDRDDEVNYLSKGRNYGWDPVPGYDQSTPMTDTSKFPSAVRARWSSGYPTIATSGLAFFDGSQWGRWEGALGAAELKGTGVRVMELTPLGVVRATSEAAELDNTYGRLRTVQPGPGGALYVTTSNGTDDKVLEVVPTPPATPTYQAGLDVSPSGAAVVARGTSVTAFVRGRDGQVYTAGQSSPGGGWSGFRLLTPGAVASAPAAVSWDGSRIDVFARGTQNHLLHSWTTASGWAPWQDLGGALTSAPAVASHGPGTLDVVARSGSGDSLSHVRYAGRWGAWTSVGGILESAASLHAEGTDRVRATAVGRDGRLYDIVLGPATVVRGWAGVGRSSSSAPATSTDSTPIRLSRNGAVPATYTGASGQAIGGELAGAPAAAERSDGSPVFVGRGLDDALWWFDGRVGHESWSKVGGILR